MKLLLLLLLLLALGLTADKLEAAQTLNVPASCNYQQGQGSLRGVYRDLGTHLEYRAIAKAGQCYYPFYGKILKVASPETDIKNDVVTQAQLARIEWIDIRQSNRDMERFTFTL